MEGIRLSVSMAPPIKAQVLFFPSKSYPQVLQDNSEPATDTGSSAKWHPASPNAKLTQPQAVTHPETELLRRETLHFALHNQGTYYMHGRKPPGAACDLMGLCTKKFRICVHHNSHCISLLRSF